MTKSNSPVWVIDETHEFLGTIPLSSLIIEVTGKDKEEINEIISFIHRKLTGGKENLQVIYEPSNGSLTLEQALARNLERDLRIKSTSVVRTGTISALWQETSISGVMVPRDSRGRRRCP